MKRRHGDAERFIFRMFTLKAPAKINWFLKIFGLRDDGFHEIQSLIQKITLYDILTFKPAKNLVLTTSRSIWTIPTEQNLVYKTAFLVKEKCGVKSDVHIHLEKHIPIAAGLGGGSSDAATTLMGLNKLWGLNLTHKELHEFAQKLGSDVPVFLNGPLALVEGRGEKVTTIKTNKQFNILLVKPAVAISTAWAYNNYKLQVTSYKTNPPLPPDNPPTSPFNKGGQRGIFKGGRGGINSELRTLNSKLYKGLTKKTKKVDNIKFFMEHFGEVLPFIKTLEETKLSKSEHNPEALGPCSLPDNFSNDLEVVVIKNFPIIAEIKNRLLEEGAMFSMMTGSGPTVVGVFASEKEASNAAGAFKEFWTTVVKTVNSEQ